MSAVDLVVIGAGPAGMAAATTAAECGLSVLLLDEQPAPGGQIYRNIEHVDGNKLADILGEDYRAGKKLARGLRAARLDYRPGTTVWRVDGDGSVAWTDGRKARLTQAAHIIAATGAMERPVPIPGWTLPGVMGAGAAQVLLKSAGMVPDGPTVIAGAGPLLFLVANQLAVAGAEIAAVLETTRFRHYFAAARHVPATMRASEYLRKGASLFGALRERGIKVQSAVHDIRAVGKDRLTGVAWSAHGTKREIAASTLLLHQGVVPNVQITRQAGADHEWYAPQRYWRPVVDRWGQTSEKALIVAGDGAGIFGAEAAAEAGRIAALGVVYRAGKIDAGERDRRAAPHRRELKRLAAVRPLLDALYPPPAEILAPPDETTVCRCEEITAGQIRESVALGATGPNQLKAYTRCGMGPCQGRLCGLTVSEVIAGARGVPVETVGYYRIRPPLKPVTLGELADMEEA